MDRGAWRATDGKVTKSQIRLKRLSMHAQRRIYIYIYIFYFWLCWIFSVAFSLVVVSGGYSSLRCASFSLQWLLSWSIGFRGHRLQ